MDPNLFQLEMRNVTVDSEILPTGQGWSRLSQHFFLVFQHSGLGYRPLSSPTEIVKNSSPTEPRWHVDQKDHQYRRPTKAWDDPKTNASTQCKNWPHKKGICMLGAYSSGLDKRLCILCFVFYVYTMKIEIRDSTVASGGLNGHESYS